MFALPDWIVLTVAPSQTDHTGNYREELGSLNSCKKKADFNISITFYCDHVPNFLEDVHDVWKYDVSLQYTKIKILYHII